MPGNVQRIFLDWHRPCLAAAAEVLADRYAQPAQRTLDMKRALLALPGARAGRRLLELLLEQSEQRNLRLIPPRIVTPSVLRDLLHTPPLPGADPITRRRAWSLALQQLDPDALATLVPTRPSAADAAQWDALAQLVENLHEALASELLTFADVPDKALQTLPHFADHARWQSLAAALRIYQSLLETAGRADPQLACLSAIADQRCRCDFDIHLLAVADMPGQLRAMLAQLDTLITALIHAPDSLAASFDEFGSLVPEHWSSASLPLTDKQIIITPRPIDQSSSAVHVIASLNAQYPADQITIGTCDDEVSPYLHQRISAYNLPVRDAVGTPLLRTAPCRFLDTLARFLSEHRYSQFAALLRHPDITDYLATLAIPELPGAINDWSSLLDRYYNDHLQSRLTGDWLGPDSPLRDRLTSLWRHIHTHLLQPLTGSRPLSQWAEPILNVLLTIFARRDLDRADPADRLVIESCTAITAVLSQLADLPPSLDQPADASHAISLVLSELASAAVPPEPLDPAIEMLGPLELHLDDAAVLIITGFNEGRFPQSVNADAFLPDSLRQSLGLMNNTRRFARDLYQLSAILHSRPHVTLIAGRLSAQGDPLTPSRLLFPVTDDPTVIPKRILRFYQNDPSSFAALPSLHAPAAKSAFTLPPQPLLHRTQPFDYLRVTDFRAYLEDPYRFALARDLLLDAIDDTAAELDGAAFGSLAHNVLDRFGKSDIVHNPDIQAVQRWLSDTLHDALRHRFGHAPQPAIRIQAAQLELRLLRFAEWHARWIADGWAVRYVEESFADHRAQLIVDDIPVALHGRIDRIDFHAATGRWAIFDYKTSDLGLDPEDVHRTGAKTTKQWIDLQLPLYRHLFRSLVPDAPVDDTSRVLLGYIRLPRAPGMTGSALAAWTPDDLRQADQIAYRVVREIRQGCFLFNPLQKLRFPDSDPFADLCGSSQFIDRDDSDSPGAEA